MRNLTTALIALLIAAASPAWAQERNISETNGYTVRNVHQGCDGPTCYTTNDCDDEITTTKCYLCCTDNCAHGCETECQDECDAFAFAIAFSWVSDMPQAAAFLKDPEVARSHLSSGWYERTVFDYSDAVELEWFYATARDPMVARWALALSSSALQDARMSDESRGLLRTVLRFGLADERDWKIRRVALNTLVETGMIYEHSVISQVVHQAAMDPDPQFATHVVRVLATLD